VPVVDAGVEQLLHVYESHEASFPAAPDRTEFDRCMRVSSEV
jgi:hypothetical protein